MLPFKSVKFPQKHLWPGIPFSRVSETE